MEILTFEVASRRCAVPLAAVVEVIRAVAVRSLPNVAPIIDGVIDLRGTLVPVMDLGQRFGEPARPVAASQHFILVRDRGRTVGLRVDQAHWVTTAERADIRPLGELASGGAPIAGIVALPDGVTLIHAVDAFLTGAERDSLDQAATSASARAGTAARLTPA